MEYRSFMSLTNYEIVQIVKDIFSTEKVTCIKKHKKDDYISCKIYTEWSSMDDNGNQITETIPDVIELRDPFQYSSKAIHADFPLVASDYLTLKQFCFAKGIVPFWVKDNPYSIEAVKKQINDKLVEKVEWIEDHEGHWYRKIFYCPSCGTQIRTESWDEKRCFGAGTILPDNKMPKFCPECGQKIKGENNEFDVS